MTPDNTLTGNVPPLELMPQVLKESAFFTHAAIVMRTFPEIFASVNVESRTNISLTTPAEIVEFRGPATMACLLTLSLELENFPSGVKKPEILVMGSPEADAVTLGSIICCADNFIAFRPPRLVRGVAQQDNIARSIAQLAASGHFRNIVSGLGSEPDKAIFISCLTREGHVPDFQRALETEYNFNAPMTLVPIKHLLLPPEETQGFGRAAVIFPTSYEGIDSENIATLCISDMVASGLQIVAAGEHCLEHIRKQEGGHNLRGLVVVAPFLTLFGASTVALWAASEGLVTTFLTSGTVLNCNPPDYYFSPVFVNDSRFTANHQMLTLNRIAHGEAAAGKACVGCNWTANLLAPRYARQMSESELAELGTNEAQLKTNSDEIDAATIRRTGMDPYQLVPASTWIRAKRRGLLTELHRFLDANS